MPIEKHPEMQEFLNAINQEVSENGGIYKAVKKIVDGLTKQYSEEIQCKFVEIHMDSELADVTITAP